MTLISMARLSVNFGFKKYINYGRFVLDQFFLQSQLACGACSQTPYAVDSGGLRGVEMLTVETIELIGSPYGMDFQFGFLFLQLVAHQGETVPSQKLASYITMRKTNRVCMA